MYQLLFTTNVNERKTFAANVPEKEVPFLTETLPTYFGYQHYGVDIYDDKVSVKSYEDYGKFHTKKELISWLYENVFKYLLDISPLLKNGTRKLWMMLSKKIKLKTTAWIFSMMIISLAKTQ